MNNIFPDFNQFSHHLLLQVLDVDSFVIDGTMGNGNDTIFLAEFLKKGKVFSFDIQKSALETTARKLEELGLTKRVDLILDSHENIEKYVPQKIKAAIFNLGYLPGGDKSIVTKPETSIVAIKSSINLLEDGGLVNVMIYPGHETGLLEERKILEFVKNLDAKSYFVFNWKCINKSEKTPYLIAIHKKGASK